MFDTIKAKLFNGASKATSVAIMVALLATTLFPTFAEAQVSPQSIWKRVGTTISPIIPSWDLVVDDLTVNGTFSGSGLAQNILTLESDGDIVATSTNSGYGLVFDYFTATSTTATSTFAGGIAVGSTLVGNASYPTIAFGDTDTGIYETLDDVLSISAAGSRAAFFVTNGMGVDATDQLWLDGAGDTYIYESTGNTMQFVAGGTIGLTIQPDRDVIVPNGKLSVGHASPDSMLSVGGTATASWVFDGGTEDGISVGAGYADGRIYVEGTGSAGVFMYDSGGTSDERTLGFQINGGTSKFRSYNDSGTTNTTFFELNHNTDDVVFDPSDNGKVGIATSTPFAKLSIVGGSLVVAATSTATSTSMTIDWRDGNTQTIRHGTSAATVGFSNYIPGQTLALEICNPGSTAGAVTFSGVLWPGGTAPTHTTTADKCDLYLFRAGNGTSTPIIYGGFNQDY